MSSGAGQRGETGLQRAPGVKVRRGQPGIPAAAAHGLEGGRRPGCHGPRHCSPHCQVSLRSQWDCPFGLVSGTGFAVFIVISIPDQFIGQMSYCNWYTKDLGDHDHFDKEPGNLKNAKNYVAREEKQLGTIIPVSFFATLVKIWLYIGALV